jgi:programmed cell death protein 5
MNANNLDEIRKKKMQELQQKFSAQQEAQEQAQQMEVQKEMLLRRILTPEAKTRLSNVKLANPQYGQQLELLLLKLYQTGQVTKMNDEQLKKLLLKIKNKKKDITIKRK